jgi:uncharacterized protein (TIGR03067 family)
MASLLINGQDAPEEQVATARLVVDGDTYTPKYEGKDIAESFRIDPETAPKSIDFTYTDGPRKGETVKGIYRLEGDRYIMCRPLRAEDPRPTRFAAEADSGLVLVVWTRDTPAEQARRKAIEVDRKAFEGTWVGETNTRDGKLIPEDEAKNVRLILTADRYTLERGGDQASRGFCKIDPTKTPKTMDISIIDGVNKGQTWLGIYELTGDTYRTCFATAGKPRPGEFSSEPGSGNILWVFKRMKD